LELIFIKYVTICNFTFAIFYQNHFLNMPLPAMEKLGDDRGGKTKKDWGPFKNEELMEYGDWHAIVKGRTTENFLGYEALSVPPPLALMS